MIVSSMSDISEDGRWVRGRDDSRARIRLFCFPYSGAGASIYHHWADQLPSIVSVWPVQYPGRESRIGEPPFTGIDPLAKAAASALLPHLAVPFAFFGHSMGALVAFELARYLRRQYGVLPVHLFISGFGAPDQPSLRAPIHQLPDEQFIEEIRRLNGTPDEVFERADLLELLLPVLRADFTLCETYQFSEEEPLACPLSVFGGLGDRDVPRERLSGWQRQAAAGVRLRLLPGDHFFLHASRAMLLQAIATDLAAMVSRS